VPLLAVKESGKEGVLELPVAGVPCVLGFAKSFTRHLQRSDTRIGIRARLGDETLFPMVRHCVGIRFIECRSGNP
jgi:hypothetical protein